MQSIDQSHVAEQIGAAGVVDAAVEMRNTDDIAATHASSHQYTLWPDTGGRVLRMHHRNFHPAKVEVAAWLHVSNEARRDLSVSFVEIGYLLIADETPRWLLACADQERRMHAMLLIAGRYKSQVAIVWAVLLILGQAIIIVDIDVYVYRAFSLLRIVKRKLESKISEPL